MTVKQLGYARCEGFGSSASLSAALPACQWFRTSQGSWALKMKVLQLASFRMVEKREFLN